MQMRYLRPGCPRAHVRDCASRIQQPVAIIGMSMGGQTISMFSGDREQTSETHKGRGANVFHLLLL